MGTGDLVRVRGRECKFTFQIPLRQPTEEWESAVAVCQHGVVIAVAERSISGSSGWVHFRIGNDGSAPALIPMDEVQFWQGKRRIEVRRGLIASESEAIVYRAAGHPPLGAVPA
jgi:hypothetical protein